MLAEDREPVQQQVAEIDGVQRPQPLLVLAVERQRQAVDSIRAFRFGHAVGRQAPVLPALDDRHQQPRRRLLGSILRASWSLLEQPDLVVGIEDGEVRLQADELGVAAQHAGAPWHGRCPPTMPSTEQPSSAATRSRISRAALLVKVTASTCHGRARPVARICASRVVSTRVLPVPAPASTSTGPFRRRNRVGLRLVQTLQVGRLQHRLERRVEWVQGLSHEPYIASPHSAALKVRTPLGDSVGHGVDEAE